MKLSTKRQSLVQKISQRLLQRHSSMQEENINNLVATELASKTQITEIVIIFALNQLIYTICVGHR